MSDTDSEKTDQKTLHQDVLGIVLSMMGGFAAVSILLALRGQESSNPLTVPVDWIMSSLGPFAGLLLSMGLAGLGVALFLRPRQMPPTGHLVGVILVAVGASVLVGGVAPHAGGALGAFVPSLLGETAGLFVGVLLGCVVLAASVRGIWWGELIARFPALAREAPDRPVGVGGAGLGAQPLESDGVSAAEALALQPPPAEHEPLARIAPAAPAAPTAASTTPRAPSVDIRLRGGVPEGAQPLDVSGAAPPTFHTSTPEEAREYAAPDVEAPTASSPSALTASGAVEEDDEPTRATGDEAPLLGEGVALLDPTSARSSREDAAADEELTPPPAPSWEAADDLEEAAELAEAEAELEDAYEEPEEEEEEVLVAEDGAELEDDEEEYEEYEEDEGEEEELAAEDDAELEEKRTRRRTRRRTSTRRTRPPSTRTRKRSTRRRRRKKRKTKRRRSLPRRLRTPSWKRTTRRRERRTPSPRALRRRRPGSRSASSTTRSRRARPARASSCSCPPRGRRMARPPRREPGPGRPGARGRCCSRPACSSSRRTAWRSRCSRGGSTWSSTTPATSWTGSRSSA